MHDGEHNGAWFSGPFFPGGGGGGGGGGGEVTRSEPVSSSVID